MFKNITTPIGQERVEFNSNRVFDPRIIVRFAEAVGMKLQKLIFITAAKGPQDVEFEAGTLADFALSHYRLCLCIFSIAKC